MANLCSDLVHLKSPSKVEDEQNETHETEATVLQKHEDQENFQKSNFSIFSYLTAELTRGYVPERDEAKYKEKRERVYTFMKTPRALEKFIVFGFFQCVDAFLFIFTFLPLRICLAFLKLITHPCGIFMCRSKKILEPAQVCDILKGIVIVISSFILNYLDISMMYHIIRGQAVIKLYVFFNMLEVADKLFVSFGHDILDSLFWTATEPRGRKREHFGVLPHLVLAISYVTTVLNVAFNSHNKALLIIMMSNNFVEIKTSLFKRVDKNNLFQISCNDARERFHYIILLFIVFVRNMTEFSWNPDHIWFILPDALMVLIAEFAVDWIKHAFITKFNEISADVYNVYALNLANDMVSSRQTQAFIDHSDLVSRRMGFTPLPLACILYQVCSRSLKVSGAVGIVLIIMGYLCLTTSKILNTVLLLGKACNLIKENKRKTATKVPESPSKEKQTATETRESRKSEESKQQNAPKESGDSTVIIDSQPTLVTQPVLCTENMFPCDSEVEPSEILQTDCSWPSESSAPPSEAMDDLLL